jgi:ankyrin repeat protein
MHAACDSGHVEVVKFLLASGAAADPVASTGATPLQRAAETGHLDIVELLLDAGADIDAADRA